MRQLELLDNLKVSTCRNQGQTTLCIVVFVLKVAVTILLGMLCCFGDSSMDSFVNSPKEYRVIFPCEHWQLNADHCSHDCHYEDLVLLIRCALMVLLLLDLEHVVTMLPSSFPCR